MVEEITLREAARRLGVSDTAVRKALQAGRIKIHRVNYNNGRPLLAWPDVERDWHANSDASKRTHVGSRGGKHRQPDAAVAPLKAGTSATVEQGDEAADGDEFDIPDHLTLAEAKQRHEVLRARLAKLELDERSGKLVPAEKVKNSAFKAARAVRDAILNIPDRLAAELAAQTDAAAIHARLSTELRDVLRELNVARLDDLQPHE